MSGWIKLHRKITKWEWYKDGNTARLFIHLLLMANHDTTRWRGVEIHRGQLLTGRKLLAEETGISEQSIRTSLNNLRKTEELTIKPTSKYSIITLCNFDAYQFSDSSINQQSNQQLTSNQPAANQQLTTSKNLKNLKNEKNEKKNTIKPAWKTDFKEYEKEFQRQLDILDQDKDWWREREEFHPGVDIEASVRKAINDFWGQELGWKNKKAKKAATFNVKATLTNALSDNRNKVWKPRA